MHKHTARRQLWVHVTSQGGVASLNCDATELQIFQITCSGLVSETIFGAKHVILGEQDFVSYYTSTLSDRTLNIT